MNAEQLAGLTDEEALAAEYEWDLWALPHQRFPDTAWAVALLLAGRGAGKSRAAAEKVREVAESGAVERIGLIGQSTGEIRDVMIEGQSGLLTIAPPWNRPHYEPSKRRLTWDNGVRATTYSDEDPDQLRGPEHGLIWADELAAFAHAVQTWDNAMLGLRLGENPQAIVTTTPKPRPLIRELVARAGTHPHEVVMLRASLLDNPHTSPIFRQRILDKYGGTRLGREQIYGELLEDVEGALWTQALVTGAELHGAGVTASQVGRKLVVVDPSGSITGDDVGIVTVGELHEQPTPEGAVLRDASKHYSPQGWAQAALAEYDAADADAILAEKNFGGDMVANTIAAEAAAQGRVCPRIIVRSALTSKQIRAEPVVALYEQGRVAHLAHFPYLVDQLVSWVPGTGRSPGAVDALVWGLRELLVSAPTSEVTIANPARLRLPRIGGR